SADPPSPAASPFPYTTLFRSARPLHHLRRSPGHEHGGSRGLFGRRHPAALPRRLSRHVGRLPRAGQPARPAGLRATAGFAAWMARGLEGTRSGADGRLEQFLPLPAPSRASEVQRRQDARRPSAPDPPACRTARYTPEPGGAPIMARLIVKSRIVTIVTITLVALLVWTGAAAAFEG